MINEHREWSIRCFGRLAVELMAMGKRECAQKCLDRMRVLISQRTPQEVELMEKRLGLAKV